MLSCMTKFYENWEEEWGFVKNMKKNPNKKRTICMCPKLEFLLVGIIIIMIINIFTNMLYLCISRYLFRFLYCSYVWNMFVSYEIKLMEPVPKMKLKVKLWKKLKKKTNWIKVNWLKIKLDSENTCFIFLLTESLVK